MLIWLDARCTYVQIQRSYIERLESQALKLKKYLPTVRNNYVKPCVLNVHGFVPLLLKKKHVLTDLKKLNSLTFPDFPWQEMNEFPEVKKLIEALQLLN